MKTSEAILLIEQTMGFNMSDEQRSILVFGHGSPTLINSCAGAGKTTTLMMSILYNALVNEINPKYVLGITFSIGLYLILLVVAGAGVMTAYCQYIKHEVKVK